MIIRCKYDTLVPIKELKLAPNNRNKHPKAQLKRLAEILAYQGWRYPIKVSNQTGTVTAGHGRIQAAQLNAWTHVPVNYQDYDNYEQEYADSVADNSIASWAELDLAGINTDLANLGPDFELDLLGILSFDLEPPVYEPLETEASKDRVEGLTKIIIHLNDLQHVQVMKRIQTCCEKAELYDLTSFFLEALNVFEKHLSA